MSKRSKKNYDDKWDLLGQKYHYLDKLNGKNNKGRVLHINRQIARIDRLIEKHSYLNT